MTDALQWLNNAQLHHFTSALCAGDSFQAENRVGNSYLYMAHLHCTPAGSRSAKLSAAMPA